jgi:hypothetical protein
MRRLLFALIAALAFLAIPQTASAQFSLGARGKLMFPTGSFADSVGTGWGLAATGDFTLIPLIKLRGEVGYNSFPGDDRSSGTPYPDLDIWSFLIGARLQLPIIYFSLDGGYYTKLDEFSVLPGLGFRFLFLDVGGRYKWTGANWFEVFGGVSF